MKIGIQTWGSDGDIRPFISLAAGLTSAGHAVTLVVSSVDDKDYSAFSESSGFRLVTAGRYYHENNDEIIGNAKEIFTITDPLRQFQLIMDILFEPATTEMYEAALKLCEDHELIIGHFIHHPLCAAAEITGRPYVTVTLNHGAMPTRFAAPPGFPSLGRWINPFLWMIAVKILDRYTLPYINRFRESVFLDRVSSFRQVWESRLLNLIAVSPSLCRGRHDWEDHNKVCGFFAMPEESEQWTIPPDLEVFLGSGPPPVYMTVGSMLPPTAPADIVSEKTRLLVEATLMADCRAVVQSHWSVAAGIPEHPAIFRTGYVPHRAVFPRCAAVIHHGGAGTTHAAASAGKPSVIIAHISDQFFWGSELKRLGIAPDPLDHLSVTPRRLASAMRSATRSSTMRERAAKIGRQMEKENGAARAVELIEGKFCKP